MSKSRLGSALDLMVPKVVVVKVAMTVVKVVKVVKVVRAATHHPR